MFCINMNENLNAHFHPIPSHPFILPLRLKVYMYGIRYSHTSQNLQNMPHSCHRSISLSTIETEALMERLRNTQRLTPHTFRRVI
jgi:hypothetical protein